MTPIELKQWQADLGLSEAAMAHYLGVPVHTLRGWIKGTRTLAAAPLRLVRVLQLIQDSAKPLHVELIREARTSEPAKRQAGRPPGSKNRAPAGQINPGTGEPHTPDRALVALWRPIAGSPTQEAFPGRILGSGK